MRAKTILKNISYSFSANFISLCVSVFMVTFVPKFLSVDDYGLWQLFLFYFSYLGFLHFGWVDGIYLRYAGKHYDELDEKLFAGQFYGIVILQLALVACVTIISTLFIDDPIKKTALICAVWMAPLVNFNNLCNFIMQITNRIKEYARLLFTERIMFFLAVAFFLLILHKNEFRYMYDAKLFSMISITLISIYLCKNLLRPQFYPLQDILQEAKANLSVGSKLLVANIASMLIIGIVRYGISMGWDVATFGKISLTLGISNFLMVFINSVSVVFFPIIKNMHKEKRALAYITIRNMLDTILFAGLIAYYPLRCFLAWWLPKYADSLIYMSILFPVCVFASKISLLINTYLKSMRKEALMLRINSISVVISVIITFITVHVLHNLNLVVFSIVLIYAFQCCLAEYFLDHFLAIGLIKDVIIDLIMCGAFITTSWFFNSYWCMLIYGVAYLLFILFHKKQIKNSLSVLRGK